MSATGSPGTAPPGPLVVVGDALLDLDLDGEAGRLAPDAPVPVLDSLVETARPGGAALAAAMAAADGHEVVLITAIGPDQAGDRLRGLLAHVRLLELPYEGPTPVKQRVRASGQALLRLDHGSAPGRILGISPGVEQALDSAGAVLVADYGRGVSAQTELRELLESLPRRVPLVWDPHPRGTAPVAGASLVTPNEKEASGFVDQAGRAPSGHGLARVVQVADGLVAVWSARAVAVTRGAQGALLSYGHGTPVITPAPAVRCLDACGAGDRFAVSAALALRSGAVMTEAVQTAVDRAAEYVAAGGPSSLFPPAGATSHGESAGRSPASEGPESVEDLLARVSGRGGTVVATGGCFDLLHAGHVATLRAARSLGDCLVVCLNSDASVARLKGPSRPLVPATDRARVLEALECVDAVVVFEEDTPVEAIRRVRPAIWAKGGDYAGADVPEAAVVEEWGGQAVVLPYLQGRSTTQMVRTAAERAVVADNEDEKEISR